MKFEHLLIITYGRSGSTLLMSILNTIEGVLIAGENYNICLHLYRAYKSLLKAKQHNGNTPKHPFYMSNFYEPEKFLKDAYMLIKNQIIRNEQNIKCWRFKEIRYTQNALKDENLEEYLNFLKCLFPNCAFLFLTRNHDEVCKSGFWKKSNPDIVKNLLLNFEKSVNIYYSNNKDYCYIIDYNDSITLSDNFRTLFESFLETTYNEKIIKEKLAIPHSYNINIGNLKRFDLKIKTFSLPEAIFLSSIDTFPIQVHLNQTFNISGVILFNHEKSYCLKIIGCSANVIYNLPSPKYGEKYPNILNSNSARFRIENLNFDSLDKTIEIYIVYNNTESLLWRLELSEKEEEA